MAKKNYMAKYLLVNLDQTERRSKLFKRCKMSRQKYLTKRTLRLSQDFTAALNISF